MMLSNIFVKVVPLLKEKRFDIDYDALAKFFERYKPGDWLYPDAMHRNIALTVKNIHVNIIRLLQKYQMKSTACIVIMKY